jgi:hypothetical protein
MLKVQAIEAGVFSVNSFAWRFSAFGEFVSCMVSVQTRFYRARRNVTILPFA